MISDSIVYFQTELWTHFVSSYYDVVPELELVHKVHNSWQTFCPNKKRVTSKWWSRCIVGWRNEHSEWTTIIMTTGSGCECDHKHSPWMMRAETKKSSNLCNIAAQRVHTQFRCRLVPRMCIKLHPHTHTHTNSQWKTILFYMLMECMLQLWFFCAFFASSANWMVSNEEWQAI